MYVIYLFSADMHTEKEAIITTVQLLV